MLYPFIGFDKAHHRYIFMINLSHYIPDTEDRQTYQKQIIYHFERLNKREPKERHIIQALLGLRIIWRKKRYSGRLII